MVCPKGILLSTSLPLNLTTAPHPHHYHCPFSCSGPNPGEELLLSCQHILLSLPSKYILTLMSPLPQGARRGPDTPMSHLGLPTVLSASILACREARVNFFKNVNQVVSCLCSTSNGCLLALELNLQLFCGLESSCTICALDTFPTSFPTTSCVRSAGPAASSPIPNPSEHSPATGPVHWLSPPPPFLEDFYPKHSQNFFPLWGHCLHEIS